MDVRNQLTNGIVLGLLNYDANGNLTGRPNLDLSYEYDDENRLRAVQVYYLDANGIPQGWRSEFAYDGVGRLQRRAEYVPQQGFEPLGGGGDQWYLDHAVFQERDTVNTPAVSYTRGLDLSGSLEGAGGIGRLLARSDFYLGGNFARSTYYHADGSGTITCMIGPGENVVASYRYDPFGDKPVSVLNGT